MAIRPMAPLMLPPEMRSLIVHFTDYVVRFFGVADSVAVSQENYGGSRRATASRRVAADIARIYIPDFIQTPSPNIKGLDREYVDTLRDSHIAVIRLPNVNVVEFIGGLSSCL